MKSRFVLTPQAKADLHEIITDIAEDNPAAAEMFLARIYEGFERLSEMPGIGHYHEELLDRRFRFWNCYPYCVCYRWEVKPIHVVAVVHGARDLEALFRLRRED